MRRVAFFLAASIAAFSAVSLGAQEADSVVPAINPPVASQPVPRLIMLSGTVKDLTGKPLTGPVDLSFAIYKEQADAAPLWQESQTLNVDEQGHYTALLGAMQPEGLPVDLFTSGEARWLGVSAGNLAEQPRVLLVSVPYALKANDAEMLGGKPASAYMLARPSEGNGSAGSPGGGVRGRAGAATADMATPGKPKSGPKPNVTGVGTQNYIPLWIDSAGTLGNSVIYQSSGSVGIGTTAPVAAVDVYGTNAGLQLRGPGTHQVAITGTTSGRVGQDAAGMFFTSDSNGGALRFYTNNGSGHEAMRITSAAYVGIGTTTPGYLLDVVGGSARVTNPSGTSQLTVSGSATSGRLGQDSAGFFFSSDTNGAALRFGTNNGSGHEWMRITSAGLVGIGTASPGYPLDVQGSSVRIANPSGTTQLIVAGSATSGRFGQDLGGLFLSSDSNGGALRFATNNGSGHEWLRITSAGNVGIGTTAPTHTLDVAGDINVSTNIKAGGNLTVTGTISGNGSSLTNLQPGSIAAGVASIDISGNANTANSANSAGFANGADTANNLQGLVPSDLAQVASSNTFSGNQTITGGNLNLDQTSSGSAGVINLGGSAFIHACCGASQANTFVGTSAGNLTITGTQNTAHGNSALSSNTSGSGNTAHGASALLNNSDASGNTAAGAGALQQNCSGVSSGCGAANNTALGYSAGVTGSMANANVTGASNTFIGALSGPGTASTSPISNATAIGANAVVGQSNTIVLGSINGVNGASSSVNVGIGTAAPATSLQVVGDIRLGTGGTNGCLQNFAGTALAGTCSSDARLKTNVQPFSPVLGKLAQLQPVHFNWKTAAYPDYHFGAGTNSGLIAQEVEKVFPELVSVDAKGLKQVNYSELPYLMLQAIRELKVENDTLRGQVEQLNAKDQRIADLARQVVELHKVQQQMATLEARFAEMEARAPKP